VVQVEGRIVYVINVNITKCVVSGEDWKSEPILAHKYCHVYQWL
jgi:hypothetical protein